MVDLRWNSHFLFTIETTVFLVVAALVAISTYNVFFHPLAKFPGPRLRAASELPYFLCLVRGDAPEKTAKLHDEYGPVVRVAPNELSFISPVAIKEIYGSIPGRPELRKDDKYYSGMGEPTLLFSDTAYHSWLRKLLAYGFSDSALRSQEAIIQQLVNVLMKRLEMESQAQRPIDLVEWYNFFAFDVISYLTYGETLDCLNTWTLHTWVQKFRNLGRPMAFSQASKRLPKLLQYPFMAVFLSEKLILDYKTVYSISQEKVLRSLDRTSDTPGFMSKLIAAYKEGKMTMYQLNSNATFLMAAGSETLVTLLAHVTYQLVMNPEKMRKVQAEVRGRFSSGQDMNIASVNQCKYLLACLDETLRIQAPSPATHPRYTPKSGLSIDGHAVPGDVAVGVPIFAACRSKLNFRDPDLFLPERWTREDARYEDDRREAAQVFSVGPRDCLGRNLAYVEMRLILARLVWQFDIERCFPEDWAKQKVYLVWEKPALTVKLKSVRNAMAP